MIWPFDTYLKKSLERTNIKKERERNMARKAKSTKSKKTMSPEVKAFKVSSEVESFYSFIHENDLRIEAKMLLETVLGASSKKRKKSKTLQ